MDISRPPTDHLPRSRTTTGGLFKSLALLSLALTIALAVGVLGVFVVRTFAPDAPAFIGIPFAIAMLVLVLRVMAHRYQWLMPWYYLLPSIVFLLTFTFFPVILTIGLAFTDYAGIRNGELNVSSETAITAVDGARITIASAASLDCEDLRDGCNNVAAMVYASGEAEVTGESIEGATLTLTQEPPAGRSVATVSLHLPDLGFDFEMRVIGQDGRVLTLERAPPSPPDLESLTVRLDRQPLRVTIAEDHGTELVLSAPLPDDIEAMSIARFNDFGFVGLRNFRYIAASASKALIPVFTWNIAFAFLTVLLNTIAGVFMAVLLNNKSLRFRNLYRTLLIVPWALPSVITIQVWRGFLNQNFGAINRLMALLDIGPEPINWLAGNHFAAKGALLFVNLWLGLPFLMTATLGALSAIPDEVYEAARIDGANAWQGFWGVTGPLLRSALIPITLSGFAFNFNNFNVIFLLTDGGPAVTWGTATARGTDILISWAYNEAFRSQGGYAYGLGSAISVIIFVITLAVSLMNFRVTGALKEVD